MTTGDTVWCERTGATIRIAEKRGGGYEGKVYKTNVGNLLIKVLNRAPTPQTLAKLRAMLNSPPPGRVIGGQVTLAWPTSLALDARRSVVGFFMPYVAGGHHLSALLNPVLRREKFPAFDARALHDVARNLAIVIQQVHAHGCVVGDLQPANILVSPRTGFVTLIDVDSFQVVDPSTSEVFLCEVGRPDHMPPEWKNGAIKNRSHDAFCLALLIHQILLDFHPYSTHWTGAGDPPMPRVLIERHDHSYRPNSPTAAPAHARTFDTLGPHLKELFRRFFESGVNVPSLRPSAELWVEALDRTRAELIACRARTEHVYHTSLRACPFCASDAAYRVDAAKRQAAAKPRAGARVAAPQPRTGPTRWTPPPVPPSPPTRWRLPRKRWVVGGLVALFIVWNSIRTDPLRNPKPPPAPTPAPAPVEPVVPFPSVAILGASPERPRAGAPLRVQLRAESAATVEYRPDEGVWRQAPATDSIELRPKAGKLRLQVRALSPKGVVSLVAEREWDVAENRPPQLELTRMDPAIPMPRGTLRLSFRFDDEAPASCRLAYVFSQNGRSSPPTYVTTDGDGRLFISNLPAGRSTFTFWAVDDADAASEQLSRTVALQDPPAPPPATAADEFVNSVGMTLVRVPGGTFAMGDAVTEIPLHGVRLPRPFLIGKHEVTNRERAAVLGQALDRATADLPWIGVDYAAATLFCRRLSGLRNERIAGRIYRIPDEAEWEYACRAGTTSAYFFGDAPVPDAAAFRRAALEIPGRYPPNRFRLHDMHAGAAELCLARVDPWTAPGEVGAAPLSASKAPMVVRRGGSSFDDPALCRSAARQWQPGAADGLRVVCELDGPHPGLAGGASSAGDLFFNGRNLYGWDWTDHWRVEGGTIVGTADGTPTRLVTLDDQRAYRLSFRLDVSEGVGFGLRPRASIEPDGLTPAGPAVLFPGRSYTEDYGFGAGARRVPWGSTQDLPSYKRISPPPKAPDVDLGPGATNLIEVEVRSDYATISINGKNAVLLSLAGRSSGRVAFLLRGRGTVKISDLRFAPI